ncbi:hypothetical protein E6R60_26730 [Streptomyces sp. A0642]|uniref:hypothetical protein n=1 Tax=Streptomyces sp. A0642 TaxID=2563100 RepID=UPI0010A275EE|nr:hypothetical protein [Streptomyces sp. A0642]THA72526.1 hypothetical protein E6R60_26730 [Streptomyces sp. A0642]
MKDDMPVRQDAAQLLRDAGMRAAEMVHEEEGAIVVRSGFMVMPDGGRAVSVLLLSAEGAQAGERDELFQQARAALYAANWRVSQNEYGTLRAVRPAIA